MTAARAFGWRNPVGTTDADLLRLLHETGVSPMEFGAAGDGRTDDMHAVTAAIAYALENGYPINGGGREYGVGGDISISDRTGPHIAALRLKQLSPATGRNTLRFTNCEQVRVDNLTIHVGLSKRLGNMDNTRGFQVHGGSGHRIRNVTVTGNGQVTYVSFWNCTDSVFENIHVHDGEFENFEEQHVTQDGVPVGTIRVPDDVVQGIHLADCTNCDLVNPIVRNLTGNATYFNTAKAVVAFANFRTRGIAGGGNVNCTVENPQVANVEQGIDFSGSGGRWGNVDCQIIGGHTVDCGSVGLKFANAQTRCRGIGHTAKNCGMMGFMMAGGLSPTYMNSSGAFIGCTAINPGYNGVDNDTDFERLAHCGFYFAFAVEGAKCLSCTAIDKQGFYLFGDDPYDPANPKLPHWPAAGETRAKMQFPWTAPSGAYEVTFTTTAGTETRTANFTAGSTDFAWSDPLAGPVTHPFVSRPARMQYGFLNEPQHAGSGRANTLGSDCESVGHVVAASKGF